MMKHLICSLAIAVYNDDVMSICTTQVDLTFVRHFIEGSSLELWVHGSSGDFMGMVLNSSEFFFSSAEPQPP